MDNNQISQQPQVNTQPEATQPTTQPKSTAWDSYTPREYTPEEKAYYKDYLSTPEFWEKWGRKQFVTLAKVKNPALRKYETPEQEAELFEMMRQKDPELIESKVELNDMPQAEPEGNWYERKYEKLRRESREAKERESKPREWFINKVWGFVLDTFNPIPSESVLKWIWADANYLWSKADELAGDFGTLVWAGWSNTVNDRDEETSRKVMEDAAYKRILEKETPEEQKRMDKQWWYLVDAGIALATSWFGVAPAATAWPKIWLIKSIGKYVTSKQAVQNSLLWWVDSVLFSVVNDWELPSLANVGSWMIAPNILHWGIKTAMVPLKKAYWWLTWAMEKAVTSWLINKPTLKKAVSHFDNIVDWTKKLADWLVDRWVTWWWKENINKLKSYKNTLMTQKQEAVEALTNATGGKAFKVPESDSIVKHIVSDVKKLENLNSGQKEILEEIYDKVSSSKYSPSEVIEDINLLLNKSPIDDTLTGGVMKNTDIRNEELEKWLWFVKDIIENDWLNVSKLEELRKYFSSYFKALESNTNKTVSSVRQLEKGSLEKKLYWWVKKTLEEAFETVKWKADFWKVNLKSINKDISISTDIINWLEDKHLSDTLAKVIGFVSVWFWGAAYMSSDEDKLTRWLTWMIWTALAWVAAKKSIPALLQTLYKAVRKLKPNEVNELTQVFLWKEMSPSLKAAMELKDLGKYADDNVVKAIQSKIQTIAKNWDLDLKGAFKKTTSKSDDVIKAADDINPISKVDSTTRINPKDYWDKARKIWFKEKEVNVSDIISSKTETNKDIVKANIDKINKWETLEPIVVSGNWKVVDGNHRLKALQETGAKNTKVLSKPKLEPTKTFDVDTGKVPAEKVSKTATPKDLNFLSNKASSFDTADEFKDYIKDIVLKKRWKSKLTTLEKRVYQAMTDPHIKNLWWLDAFYKASK